MHIFHLLIQSGPRQSSYLVGTELAAVCMVDSQSTDDSRQKASHRLFELGWELISFQQTVLLPPAADISQFDRVMTQCYRDAERLGVSLIEFPEFQSST